MRHARKSSLMNGRGGRKHLHDVGDDVRRLIISKTHSVADDVRRTLRPRTYRHQTGSAGISAGESTGAIHAGRDAGAPGVGPFVGRFTISTRSIRFSSHPLPHNVNGVFSKLGA